jgi:hypothetical protein
MSQSQDTTEPWSFIEDGIHREAVALDTKAVMRTLVEVVDALKKEPSASDPFLGIQKQAFMYEALTAISALKKIQEIGNAKPSDIGL